MTATTYDQLPDADVVLPEQFFATPRALPESERRLRLAILEDALRYYRQYGDTTDRRARALYEDAAEWFASGDRSEPFAFENVCDALGLDASYIRRGLQRWTERRGRPFPGPVDDTRRAA
jgi:hypothetical protein